MATGRGQRQSHADYTIACICPTGFELAAVEGMLDDIHHPLPTYRDQNAYTLGRIGVHNVVVGVMYESNNHIAATVATQLQNDFPSIRFGLLVGIGGGVPGKTDIRLGDVVISQATGAFGGVVQYDLGKREETGRFRRTGLLNKPPSLLSAAVRKLEGQYIRQGHRLLFFLSEMLQRYPRMKSSYAYPTEARDDLFQSSYVHIPGIGCDSCDRQQLLSRRPRTDRDPQIHYGTIGSANCTIEDASLRDKLREDMDLLCVETEAAGLMDDFPCVVIRGICDYADSHKNYRWQPYAAALAAAYMKELLLSIPGKQVTDTASTSSLANQASVGDGEVTDSGSYKASDEDIFASLAFPQMRLRQLDVQSPHPNTCRWILNSTAYKEWNSQHQGLLWIKGKPGAGKSTIMSFLFSSMNHQRSTDSEIRLEFFFSARGVHLQHNFIGMLRSLLSQLFQHAVASRGEVRQSYESKCVAFGQQTRHWEWHERELKDLFTGSLFEAARHHRILLLVDALDEVGESAARIIADYLHLISNRITAESLPVKICVSCRHHPLVFMGLGTKICVEDNNQADIAAFIEDRFALLQAETGRSDRAKWYNLQLQLMKQAKGVFQWVKLVMGIVEKSIGDGLSFKEVQLEIQELPAEISEVYRHILLNVINARYRSQSFLLFQWTCLAQEPLSLEALRYALAATYAVPGSDLMPNVRSHETSDFIETDENMRTKVYALSGGLLEVIGQRVQVVHQTVNEFLELEGLALLSPFYKSPDNSCFGEQSDQTNIPEEVPVWCQCQSRMYWSCLKYLATEPRSTRLYLSGETREHLEFFKYAAKYALLHARQAWKYRRQNLADQAELIRRALPFWSHANDSVGAYDWTLPNYGTTALHMAAGSDLHDLVVYLLDSGGEVDTRDEAGRTALHFAARWASEHTVGSLIAAGADTTSNMDIIMGTTDQIIEHGRTPLTIAAQYGRIESYNLLLQKTNLKVWTNIGVQALLAASRNGHASIVQSLIASGVEANAHSEYYGNALQAACLGAHLRCVQVLLDAGADVNAQGGYFGNALEAASNGGDERIVQILLGKWADADGRFKTNWAVCAPNCKIP